MMFVDKRNKIYSSEELDELTTMELESLNFHVCDRSKPVWGEMDAYI